MRAIDTNIIVRLITNDDPDQALKARAVLEEGSVFVATTVLLESEWVLRSAYGYARQRVLRAIESLCGLPGITLEDPVLIAQALEWAGRGMDFADALHLARADGCSAFVSFDRKLARAAQSLTEITVISP